MLSIKLKNDEQKYMKSKNKVPNTLGDEDRKILQRYNEYMNTEDQRALRESYRNDDTHRHTWTEDELARFELAYKKYGNGPTSNKKIAAYIGTGVHPNNVAFLKQQHRKIIEKMAKNQGKEVKEVKESIQGLVVEPQTINQNLKSPDKQIDWNCPETFTGRSVVVWFGDIAKYFKGKVLKYDYEANEHTIEWEGVIKKSDRITHVDLFKQNMTMDPRNSNRWHFVD